MYSIQMVDKTEIERKSNKRSVLLTFNMKGKFLCS